MPERQPSDLVTAGEARRLLLSGQGLLADPTKRATGQSVRKTIQRLGYVQVDTISIVQRAHHHILMTRIDGYRPEMLRRLLEQDRKLFEHWTHDASVIPIEDFRFWRVRFERERQRQARRRWWRNLPEGEPQRLLKEVRLRLEKEGPLKSADFEGGPARANGWWNWKPAKAALEHLWRVGEVSVSGRAGFQKIYHLTERVFPQQLEVAVPDEREHIEWACWGAMERLTIGTIREIQTFYEAVSNSEVRNWCRDALNSGRIVEVLLAGLEGAAPRPGFALPDWKRRAKRTPPAPDRMRILSPFDPAIRDRQRTARVFGFDYRFEAFVPAAKRRHGYYVMPILEGDRLVGRLDARLLRKEGTLEVLSLWWEPRVEVTRHRSGLLEDALELYATQTGATSVTGDVH